MSPSQELAAAIAIPAALAFGLAMLLPEPEATEIGVQVSGVSMPTAEPEHVWTWPIAEEEPAAEPDADEEHAPHRRHRRHGRRG